MLTYPLFEKQLLKADKLKHQERSSSRFRAFIAETLSYYYDWDGTGPLADWCLCHPAAALANQEDYRRKFSHPRLVATDLPTNLATALQAALENHLNACLPPYAKASRRLNFLRGADEQKLLKHARSCDKNALPREYSVTWRFVFIQHPEEVDLVDRNEYLRIFHYTNLTVIKTGFSDCNPFSLADSPSCDPFSLADFRTWFSKQYARRLDGRYVSPKEVYD